MLKGRGDRFRQLLPSANIGAAVRVKDDLMISICICTYNRSKSLWRTLDSIAKLNDIKSTAVEILIVDKNCSDGSSNVVEAFREKLPIRRVSESRDGLAYARNKAITEFRGDVLLFTDDDVTVAPGWLAAYEHAIRHFPDADYFGGRILPDWGGAKPRKAVLKLQRLLRRRGG